MLVLVFFFFVVFWYVFHSLRFVKVTIEGFRDEKLKLIGQMFLNIISLTFRLFVLCGCMFDEFFIYILVLMV